MVDIARDPRWGRIIEGAGEDPYLGAAIAAAQVRGFQGAGLGTPERVIAGPKHFAGYGAALGGRDYDEVEPLRLRAAGTSTSRPSRPRWTPAPATS